MKITIDTTSKTISVEGTVKMGDLITELKKILTDLDPTYIIPGTTAVECTFLDN